MRPFSSRFLSLSLQACVQRCIRNFGQRRSLLGSLQAGQQQAVRRGHVQAAHWLQKVRFFTLSKVITTADLYTFDLLLFPYFPNRPEKMAKLPVLLGNLDVTIDSVAPDVTSKPSKYLLSTSIYNRQTSTLNPVTPLLFPVCRLCHFLLHPHEELRRQRARQRSPGGGGVCTLHRQVLPTIHHLQKPPLCVPETPQIRRTEILCKGETVWMQLQWCNLSLFSAQMICTITILTFICYKVITNPMTYPFWRVKCFLATVLSWSSFSVPILWDYWQPPLARSASSRAG